MLKFCYVYFASIFKMKTKKKKKKTHHIGYFFFKVPDSQKPDNLKQQEKLSVLGFLFFNWENYKSETLWPRKTEHILILTVDPII